MFRDTCHRVKALRGSSRSSVDSSADCGAPSADSSRAHALSRWALAVITTVAPPARSQQLNTPLRVLCCACRRRLSLPWYSRAGRGDVPLGAYKGPWAHDPNAGKGTADKYLSDLVDGYPRVVKSSAQVNDTVTAYVLPIGHFENPSWRGTCFSYLAE